MATGIAGMDHSVGQGSKRLGVAAAILFVVVGYGVASVFGWPQYGTDLIVAGARHDRAAHTSHPASDHAAEAANEVVAPPLFSVIPFVLLLGGIAVLPLIPATSHWWESNVNRFKLAASLALATLAYYALVHNGPLEGHWPAHFLALPSGGVFEGDFVLTVLGNAILQEYIPFIVLLFSLYTISGGIRIEGDLRAHPMTNATFMGVGGILASFIGTTGAAMLLIRPLLETNKERRHSVHTVVFFIFIVCNCGGTLLPIGDPPLFLGYLQGVDFFWTLRLWEPWLFVNGLLLLLYLVLDGMWFYPKETVADIRRDVTQTRRLTISGWKLNAPLLLGVVLAVALLDPSKAFPGTQWHPWMYLREVAQLSLVAISLWIGSAAIREANRFSYHAIVEVAVLFVGIFVCMQPALQILALRGGELGITTPSQFFWVTGGLSSVLDNAPTYLVFFKTAQAIGPDGAVSIAGVAEPLLVAVSLGAVFMGAMTYIGNGPNFMVKALAEEAGVRMPSFFGYMVYSTLVLLPILALMAWRFLPAS